MKILYIVAATLFCFSCNTNTNSETSTSPKVGNTHNSVINHTDTVYLVRNADVTPANAYSDLFLDSSVINKYISENKLPTDAEKGYKSFYNYRNDQFAWFSSQGLTEQAKAFWNLQDKLGSKADKGLRNRMDTLLNNDSLIISRYDTAILKTELALTNAYLNFYKTNRNNLQFASLSPEKAIPVRKQNTILWADSILQQRSDSNFSNTPTHYSLLKEKLKVYTELAKNQGWPTILGSARQLKKGSSSPAISTIKKRLQLTGDMAGTDTSAVFNDTLVAVIKNYQMHNGMQPTGIITDTLIRSLNVPVEKRLQ
ncbi:MAG: peptidoglycan-binding protein [Ferruginibacter sp.]